MWMVNEWLQIGYDNIHPIYALSIFYYISFVAHRHVWYERHQLHSTYGLLRNRKFETMSQLFLVSSFLFIFQTNF